MKLLYMRGNDREELDEQLRAMADAGLAIASDRTMIDRGSEQSLPGFIASGLSSGDTIVVQSPTRLAANAADAFDVAFSIVTAGASLLIAEPRLELDTSTLPGLIFASVLQDAVRTARRVGGAKGGRPRMPPDVEEKARRAWIQGHMDKDSIAAEAGVSVRTLQRMFGRRPR